MGPIAPALALACRVVLASVLAAAAVAKVADRRALPGRLREMGISPGWSARFAVGLPIVEVAVAVALVAVPHSWLPAAAALALLAAFTVFLLATLRRAVPCPCFGTVRTDRAVSGPGAVVRNGVLLALAVLATGAVDGARAGGTIVGVAVVGLAAVLAITRVA
jgi:hypothetical protein